MTADFFRRAAAELDRAATIHRPRFASLHEAMAVLAEEVHEVWQHVRAKTPDSEAIYTECVQVAAMAAKMAVLCELPKVDTPDPQPAQDREGHGFEVFVHTHPEETVEMIRLSDALARIAEVEGERDYWKEHAANRLRHGVEFRAERDEARAEVERLREVLADARVTERNWKMAALRTQPPAPVRGPEKGELTCASTAAVAGGGPAQDGSPTATDAGASGGRASDPVDRIVRHDPDDEFVAHGHIHVERMGDHHIWMNLAGVAMDLSAPEPIHWSTQEPVEPTPAPAVRGPDGPVTWEMVDEAAEAFEESGLGGGKDDWAITMADQINAALAATPTGAGGRVRVTWSVVEEVLEEFTGSPQTTADGIERMGAALRTVLGIEIEDALEQATREEDSDGE